MLNCQWRGGVSKNFFDSQLCEAHLLRKDMLYKSNDTTVSVMPLFKAKLSTQLHRRTSIAPGTLDCKSINCLYAFCPAKNGLYLCTGTLRRSGPAIGTLHFEENCCQTVVVGLLSFFSISPGFTDLQDLSDKNRKNYATSSQILGGKSLPPDD